MADDRQEEQQVPKPEMGASLGFPRCRKNDCVLACGTREGYLGVKLERCSGTRLGGVLNARVGYSIYSRDNRKPLEGCVR